MCSFVLSEVLQKFLFLRFELILHIFKKKKLRNLSPLEKYERKKKQKPEIYSTTQFIGNFQIVCISAKIIYTEKNLFHQNQFDKFLPILLQVFLKMCKKFCYLYLASPSLLERYIPSLYCGIDIYQNLHKIVLVFANIFPY